MTRTDKALLVVAIVLATATATIWIVGATQGLLP